MHLDFEGREKSVAGTKEMWEEFRQALKEKKFNYKELDKAKEYNFLRVLDAMLIYGDNKEIMTTTLEYISKNASLCRATKLNESDDIGNIPYSRFIPDQVNHPSENRFSPAGIDYLYLAIRFGRLYLKKAKYNYLEQTCLNEIRAQKDDNVAFCKFKINEDVFCKNIIDLTIVDDKSPRDLEYETETWFKSMNIHNVKNNAGIQLFKLFFKIISEEIFKPIETDDKELEYAPFHCLSEYFISLGFEGIIYRSTVYENGKNLVLFSKNDAYGFDKIRIEKY